MANLRARGKIPHSEWPEIAGRVAAGETLAAVARSYRCTAPAIRYIVRRMPALRPSSDGEPGAGQGRGGATTPAVSPPISPLPSPVRGGSAALNHALWSRVNVDIAVFLSAVDALMTNNTAANEQALLSATDQLLRATARTRLELEKAMSHYDTPRQRSGSGD